MYVYPYPAFFSNHDERFGLMLSWSRRAMECEDTPWMVSYLTKHPTATSRISPLLPTLFHNHFKIYEKRKKMPANLHYWMRKITAFLLMWKMIKVNHTLWKKGTDDNADDDANDDAANAKNDHLAYQHSTANLSTVSSWSSFWFTRRSQPA